MAEPLVLETERPGVVARQLCSEADDAAYHESYGVSSPEIAVFDPQAYDRHRTVDDTRRARLEGDDAGRLRMGIWDDDNFVASVNARPQPDGSIEVGYWADSRHTARGYTSLGTAALVRFLAQDYQRIFTHVREDNPASARVSEKAGLRRVALAAGQLTFELISERPCPFPQLEGAEQDVRPGGYKVIDGSDAPQRLDYGDVDLFTPSRQYCPELIPGVRLRGVCNTRGKDMAVVSFLYNKLTDTGQRERDQRVIAVEGIGYGVHPDHTGQPPTWHLIGPKLGTINHETGEYMPSVELPEEVPANNFSIACITHGPFGVPLLANPEKLPAAR